MTAFLIDLVENKKPAVLFLVNGVKLQGVIEEIDSSSGDILLERNGHRQLVYHHAISTISAYKTIGV